MGRAACRSACTPRAAQQKSCGSHLPRRGHEAPKRTAYCQYDATETHEPRLHRLTTHELSPNNLGSRPGRGRSGPPAAPPTGGSWQLAPVGAGCQWVGAASRAAIESTGSCTAVVQCCTLYTLHSRTPLSSFLQLHKRNPFDCYHCIIPGAFLQPPVAWLRSLPSVFSLSSLLLSVVLLAMSGAYGNVQRGGLKLKPKAAAALSRAVAAAPAAGAGAGAPLVSGAKRRIGEVRYD